jgi:hypothetical protein
MSKIEFNQYDKSVHRLGFWSTLVLVLAIISVPFMTQQIFHLSIDVPTTLKTFFTALSVFAPVAICEFISYVPLLGAGGLYIAFVTGNVMNMKLPAAKNAQKICNVESGTPESEAISTLAAAVSTMVTTVILVLGMLLTVQILPFLQADVFKPAFGNINPAIFSAIALPVFVKAVKSSSVPVGLAILLTIALSFQVLCAATRQFYVLPGFLILAVLWEYMLYRRNSKAQGVTR